MAKTYLKLEDVYTTGIIAQDLKIKRMNIGDFANKKVNLRKTGFCALNKLISMHMVAYHEQFELWKRILDGRTKCKVIYTNKSANSKNLSGNTNSNSNNNSNSHSAGGGTAGTTNSSTNAISNSVSSSGSSNTGGSSDTNSNTNSNSNNNDNVGDGISGSGSVSLVHPATLKSESHNKKKK